MGDMKNSFMCFMFLLSKSQTAIGALMAGCGL